MATKIPDYLMNDDFFVGSLDDDMAAGLSGSSPPYISIEGNKFTLVNGDEREAIGEHTRELGVYIDVCLVQANPNISRIYYEKPYAGSGGAFVPPDCWSDNGLAPSKNCGSPQSATCATCPHAVWGSSTSARTGRGVPRCASAKKVAVLVPGETHPYLMRIPAGSHKNLRAFLDIVGRQQLGQRRMSPADILTRISFDQTQGNVGILQFRPASFISQEMMAERNAVSKDPSIDQLIGKTDQPITDISRIKLAASQGQTAHAAGQPSLAAPTAKDSNVAVDPTAVPLSERAMAQRQGTAEEAAQQRKRGRPKTVLPAPKNSLPPPQEVHGPQPFDEEADHEAEEARQSFGVATDAPEPPGEHEAALQELFGRI
jgi:hypothetical protein